MQSLDEMLDDTFHSCAFAAFVEVAQATGQPPTMEAARALAYELYEDAVARKNSGRPRWA